MDISNIIVCPKCKGKVREEVNSLYCTDCKINYENDDEILRAVPSMNDTFSEIEEKFWNNAYDEQGHRSIDDRNSYFHNHFRAPLLSLPDNAVILEIACGSRADSLELAQKGKNIIATDISTSALKYALALAKKIGISERMKFVQADANHLPFRNNSIDGILIAAAFHHLENPEIGLQEMVRVTKNNGIIVFGVEPNKWPYKTIYRLLDPIKKYIRSSRDRKHDSVGDDSTEGFNRKDFKRILNNAGIEIIDIKPVKYLSEWYDSYVRLKSRLLKKDSKASVKVSRFYEKTDVIFEKIPLVSQLSWHWNVIGRVKK